MAAHHMQRWDHPVSMLAFLLRRLISIVVVLVAVTAVVFSVFYAFRPEDMADGTGYFHQLFRYLD
ncbi:MAG: hypothetical protein M3P44_15755, partial [Actinomycetota bacterium]|nr:hypothetical protein [Actinomycetota bacterium]